MVLSRGRTGSVKVKILHFAHCFFPEYGGTTTRLYNLLTNEKNEHYLYVPEAPFMSVPDNIGALENEENFGNIKVRRCKLLEDFRIKIPVLNTFKRIEINSNRLINSVKEKKFEIVHGHNPQEFAIAAEKYAKGKDIPFVYEVHSLRVDASIPNKKQYIPKIAYLLIRELFKMVLEELKTEEFGSAIDIGCGDGFFIGKLFEKFPTKKIVGIDSSARAISLVGEFSTATKVWNL